jgi:rod shape-determining protein MreC
MLGLDRSASLTSYRPLTARVIGRSPTVWYQTLNVDRGSSSGVRVDQPVIDGDGLVGKVTSVTGSVAQVTLITDHTSGVSAKVADTGVNGIVQPAVGNPNDLLLDFVSSKNRVVKGEAIVTAGSRSNKLESLFPPGIPIGSVTRVDAQEVNLYQRVHVTPYADLRKLDFVQILTRPAGGG